jgi:ribonucleoside-diphosphate reductase alpha chain
MVPFEESGAINEEIFIHLHEQSRRATQWMAQQFGEPEWCKGFGVRNTHLLAVAPNTTSALVCGGVSQGIEPVPEIVYVQPSSAGELERINPVFLEFAKEKGKWNKALAKDIINNNGSVQHLDWLTDHEKKVFKTAFEIDQYSILKLASDRQKYIDQAQSINLFFDADASEAYISAVHKYGIQDQNIKSLYYMRSKAGVKAAEESACEACEG